MCQKETKGGGKWKEIFFRKVRDISKNRTAIICIYTGWLEVCHYESCIEREFSRNWLKSYNILDGKVVWQNSFWKGKCGNNENLRRTICFYPEQVIFRQKFCSFKKVTENECDEESLLYIYRFIFVLYYNVNNIMKSFALIQACTIKFILQFTCSSGQKSKAKPLIL